MSKPVSSFPERVQEALTILGITQTELIRRTNMPKSTLSQYISGSRTPKSDKVYEIAQALGVSPAWLLGYNVPMHEKTETSPQVDEFDFKLLTAYKKSDKTTQKIIKKILDL